MLDDILRNVPRRYRVPETLETALIEQNGNPAETVTIAMDAARPSGESKAAPAEPAMHPRNGNPATAVAVAMEAARSSVDSGMAPDEATKRRFLQALAQLIRTAMRADQGDPAFQAMVLRHHAAQVREYASLSARADQDRRVVRAAVNAVAHPAKQQRASSAPLAEALAQFHAAAFASSWAEFSDTARQILELPEIAGEPALARGIARILDGDPLSRLRRLEDLEPDELVQQYRSLRGQNGPRSGSLDAAAQGSASKKRGAQVEALAARALQALADRLNEAEGSQDTYRVVTSLRVPAAIVGDAQRGKGEWDAVLLRKAATLAADNDATSRRFDGPTPESGAPIWDICLLVEAKASVDAATTDLPRLLRGIRLLAQADRDTLYAFNTQRETVLLTGASLSVLKTDEAELRRTVLYCCDAPAEASPRLLSPASRMQLLSAQASLEFAGKLVRNEQPDPQGLEPVWHQLLESPPWRPVLNQYRTLHRVRDLMVHAADLMTAIQSF